jgi:hypothetical protein
MAGDWIKMRAGLLASPKVYAIAMEIGSFREASKVLTTGYAGPPCEVLSVTALRNVTVTALLVTWASANEHSRNGVLSHCDLFALDEISGLPGFGAAMESVGWAVYDPQKNAVILPNFKEWNSPAEDRTNAERQRRYRERRVTPRNAVTVTVEKRRVEKIEEQPSVVATTETPKRRRSQPADSIRWTPAAGWEGITTEDRAAWGTAYPACDIAGELARMTEWLRANPAKAKKSRWRAFATSWLTRSQDKGGGKASNRPGDTPPAKAWADRATWRDDACRNLTDAQYRAWKATQTPSRNALELAGSLSAVLNDSP